jgi:hypothetical protein
VRVSELVPSRVGEWGGPGMRVGVLARAGE